jgi:hypothetical protein
VVNFGNGKLPHKFHGVYDAYEIATGVAYYGCYFDVADGWAFYSPANLQVNRPSQLVDHRLTRMKILQWS